MKQSLLERTNCFKEILMEGDFFKINFTDLDSDHITKIGFLYSIAGCKAFNTPTHPEIISKLRSSIIKASQNSDQFQRPIINPFIITRFESNTLFDLSRDKIYSRILDCFESGADFIQLNISNSDLDLIMNQWKLLSTLLPDRIISLCVNRKFFSNVSLLEIIKFAYDLSKDNLVIEIDSLEKNFSGSGFNGALQSISLVDIINKQLKLKDRKYRKLPLLVSGGSNLLIGKLAKQCGVSYDAVSLDGDNLVIPGKFPSSLDEVLPADLSCCLDLPRSIIAQALDKDIA